MSQTIKNYTFDKTAKTVTFTDFVSIEIEHVELITNVTTNTIIYQFNNPAKGGTVSNNVLTLTYDTTAMNNADQLMIKYTIGETGAKGNYVNDNVIGKVAPATLYFDDDFGGASLNTSKWETPVTGSGHTTTVTTSQLQLATGTTASTSNVISSKRAFIGEMIMEFTAYLSQRIANQEFYVELVGLSNNSIYARWMFSGTVVTTAAVHTSDGTMQLSNAAITTLTSAAAQTFYVQRDKSGFSYGQRAVNSSATHTLRALHTYDCPPLDEPLFVRIRAVNLGTAPASTTTFRIENIRLIAQETTQVSIQGGTGIANIASSIPVQVMSTVSTAVTGTVTANQGTAHASALWGTKTNAATGTGYTSGKLISAATTNATVIKASTGTLGFVSVTNTNASPIYIKFYNKATAPTVGTDVPVQTYLVPANGSGSNLSLPTQGLNFSLGIGFATTTGAADTDTGAVAAGEVIVNYGFI